MATHITLFIIILLLAIVVSDFLDKAFPKLPLPLVQVGCGVLIAISPVRVHVALDPEVFMGLLIAPLLYREAEETDFGSLWKRVFDS
jgi:CPA1 family monovalent cation:H+ antiporter